MFESSRDVLNYTLTGSVIILTALIAWVLVYIIGIFRQAYNFSKGLKEKMDLLDGILKSLKEKITHTANYLGLIVGGLEKIVDYVQRRKEKSAEEKAEVKNKKIKKEN